MECTAKVRSFFRRETAKILEEQLITSANFFVGQSNAILSILCPEREIRGVGRNYGINATTLFFASTELNASNYCPVAEFFLRARGRFFIRGPESSSENFFELGKKEFSLKFLIAPTKINYRRVSLGRKQ